MPGPLNHDLRIPQGADWPGDAFTVVDRDGHPMTLRDDMLATGAIKAQDRVSSPVLFRWSSQPGDDSTVGLIRFDGTLLIPTMTRAQTLPLTFRSALYQLYLHDPQGPDGEQDSRLAEGTVYLSPYIG